MMKEANELSANARKIALLVSISCVLQISESLIPHPIPGIRLGLANVMTLIALVNLGPGCAMEVSILRTILSSFLMGSFMSPAFILSFFGAVISTLVMGLLYWLSRSWLRYRLSIVGISVIGALSHNVVQLCLAYFILVKHPGIFVFLPWACIGAVIMGWITGVAAGRVCLKLKGMQAEAILPDDFQEGSYGLPVNQYSPGNSFIHRLPPEVKIFSVFALSVTGLIINNFWLCSALFLLLLTAVLFSQTSFACHFSGARRYSSLMFASFLFPVFFSSGTHVVSRIIYFKVTAEGLSAGALFTWRMIFLILASSLLTRTTPPKKLAEGIARILSPLRPLGIRAERIAVLLFLSWRAIPVFWEMAKGIIHKAGAEKIRNPRNLIPFLSGLIAALYLQTEQAAEISWN